MSSWRERMNWMSSQVIIALDFPEVNQAESFLQRWHEQEKPFIKVGYQLFYQVGSEWVARRKEEGYKIFLDLKLHDIPQTVANAVNVLVKLDVDLLTLHAAGGTEMIKAAADQAAGSNTKLLAVTQLTSTDQTMLNEELQIVGSVADSVIHLSQLAHHAGADGVICSGHEVKQIKQATSSTFLAVTPGIRPAGSKANDQKRIVTPAKAVSAGADFLVVGRPITKAAEPLEVYRQIQNEIKQQKGIRS